MNIGEYLPRLRLGEYSPIITEPEANNCLISTEIKKPLFLITTIGDYERTNHVLSYELSFSKTISG